MVHTMAIQDLIDDAIQLLTIWMHGLICFNNWKDGTVH